MKNKLTNYRTDYTFKYYQLQFLPGLAGLKGRFVALNYGWTCLVRSLRGQVIMCEREVIPLRGRPKKK